MQALQCRQAFVSVNIIQKLVVSTQVVVVNYIIQMKHNSNCILCNVSRVTPKRPQIVQEWLIKRLLEALPYSYLQKSILFYSGHQASSDSS